MSAMASFQSLPGKHGSPTGVRQTIASVEVTAMAHEDDYKELFLL
jgi:hypothetical protein